MADNNDLITIEAKFIAQTDFAWKLDCEGDIEWFPKSSCKFNKEKEELMAPKWLLKQKFPGEDY